MTNITKDIMIQIENFPIKDLEEMNTIIQDLINERYNAQITEIKKEICNLFQKAYNLNYEMVEIRDDNGNINSFYLDNFDITDIDFTV